MQPIAIQIKSFIVHLEAQKASTICHMLQGCCTIYAVINSN